MQSQCARGPWLSTTFCRLLLLIAAILVSVPTAFGADLTYRFGGNAGFFNQTAVSHDGVDAWQSGAISHSQSSWMETTVTGPGAVRFWWKVSSESSCDLLRFSIDGASQTDISGEVDWQSRAFAVAEGTHTLRWSYATDNSVLKGSNAGWVDQVSFTPGTGFDVTAPVTSVTPSPGTYAAGQLLTLSCTDAVGCTGTFYCLGSGCTPTTPYSAPLTLNASGALRFSSVDAAGNNEAVRSANFYLDTTPPDTYVTLDEGTYHSPRLVGLYCSDSGTGCRATYYCLGSECSPTTPYSVPISLTASTDLRFYSTDLAGQSEPVETRSYVILPDTAAPVTTTSPSGGTYGPSSVYLSCNDADGTGCASTYYCLGADCTPATLYASSIALAGSTDLRFYSQDRSGNRETVQSVSYNIDVTAPVTAATPPGGSYQAAPTVALSCSDAGTGCSDTFYCMGDNCAPTTLYRGPIPIRDTSVLRYYSSDRGTNRETVVTQTYQRPGAPRTIAVPGVQPTVQAAIDAAYNGDTVLVAPGTYQENLNFKGKSITVTSRDGAASTIIDGNGAGPVASFTSGETRAAVLNGFTLRNGNASSGRGDGGGIYINYAAPTVTNNVISGNVASWGAGIYIGFAAPSLRNNVITGNRASSIGGGITVGGAGSDAEIVGNTITGNSSSSGGGLAFWAAGATLVQGNLITDNIASSQGGGAYLVNSSGANFLQNVVANNRGASAGAVYAGTDRGSFVNNTFVNNDAADQVSAYVPWATFKNNIVVALPGHSPVSREASAVTNFSNNIMYAPAGGADPPPAPAQYGGSANLSADPRLSDPGQGRYGLSAGSPAIDAGDGAALYLTADLGGNPRVLDGNGDGSAVVDLGAYEFDPASPVALLQGVPAEWISSGSLALTVGGAGVVSYRYALDGGAFGAADIPVATALALEGLANGRHTVVVLAKDAQGLEQRMESATGGTWVVNTESSPLSFSYGGAAPWAAQAEVSRDGIAYRSGAIGNGQSSWMETTVTGPGAVRFWWQVSCEPYGDQLRFSIDGTPQAEIRGEIDWQARSMAVPAGTHALRWSYATDSSWLGGQNAGWVDQIVYQQGSGQDVTPPTTSATPAAGTYSSSRSVTLSCSDGDGGGCSATFYCLGSGCTPNTPYGGAITIASASTLRFSSLDAAGNYEPVQTATYRFDTVPPTTSASPGAGSYSGPRDVSLYCGDGGMGCAATFYCLGSDCNPATPYSGPIAITGSTVLRLASVDNGGNREPAQSLSYTITPDVTPPVTSVTYPAGSYQALSVNLYCNDGAGSGCAGTYYCLGAGCTPATAATGYLAIALSTDLRFFSVDRSGNRAEVSTVSYLIDVTPPTTTPGVAGGFYTSAQSVALSCSDGAGSGCSKILYCLGRDCSPTTRYGGPVAVAASDYLRYCSRDVVGNQEAVRTERYTIAAPRATINVPADRGTIQGAIDAAGDGDTVLVAPGTYPENIDFKGKAITVASSGGPEATIIDGGGQGSVVSFGSGEWYTSVLRGFTVRNGRQQAAGGYLSGGGVYVHGASPTIVANRIVQNQGCYGAGIYSSGSPVIQGNLISNNAPAQSCYDFRGGGILLSGGAAQVLDNTISNNTIPGGATLSGYGGGIGLSEGTALIRGNVITGNGGNRVYGGGIYTDNANGTRIVQNLIADNRASYGGGAYLSTSTEFVNNTVAGNDAATGSGLLLTPTDWYVPAGSFLNNVIAGRPGQSAVYREGSAPGAPFAHNLLFSATGDLFGGSFPDLTGVDGNLSADPLFSGAGHYGLRPGSPALDAGANAAAGLGAGDLDGAPRLIDATGLGQPRVDLGAYEFDPDEPRALLQGAPSGATRESSASVTVGGEGIVSYRYALDGAPFGAADIPVQTPIALDGLTAGAHALVVIGKSEASEQRASSASVAQWVIDTLAPVTAATPSGGTYTAPQSVTLSCSDGPGSGCAGTFYCLGSQCTPDLPYTGPIGVASDAGLRFFSRDAFGNRETVTTVSYRFVAALSGRVTDSGNGAAISGAVIEVYDAATGLWVGWGRTDDSGAYRVPGLSSGSYQLVCNAGDYIVQWYGGASDRSAATAVAVSAPGATADLNLALVRGGSISGTVTGQDTGHGIPEVYVFAYDAASGTYLGQGYTDSSGSYRISGLAAGTYKVRFDGQSNTGYLSQWYGNQPSLALATPVTVAGAGSTGGINATLQKGGTLSGRVTDRASGAALGGVSVSLLEVSTGSYLYGAGTDDGGAYRFTGLSGRFKVRFNGAGYQPQWFDGADQASATVVIVTPGGAAVTGVDAALLKGGSITGRVTDSVSGAALEGAQVRVLDATGGWVAYGRTGSLGTYSIAGLATGSYRISFALTGYIERWSGGAASQDAAAQVAVTAPGETAGCDMALVRGATITGRISDRATGAPLQGAYVYAVDAVTGSWGGSATTTGTGLYSISGLADGGYKIQASNDSAGYVTKWYGNKDQMATADPVQVSAPNTISGIDIALEKGGAITGTVTDAATGTPLGGVWVDRYDVATGQNAGVTNTDNAGRYRLGGVPTGSFQVRFSYSGYLGQWYGGTPDRAAAVTVSVTAPGTEAGVDAALTKGGSVSGIISDKSTGAGIAQARVTLADPVSGDWSYGAYTDDNGAYLIDGLASGSFRVRIEAPSHSAYLGRWYGGQAEASCADLVIVSAPAATTGIDAALERGGSISGRVTDAATGSGLAGASVSLSDSSGRSVSTPQAVFDATGAYTVGGVPSGDYQVTFFAPGYLTATSQTLARVAAPGAVTGLDVGLFKGAEIRGRVTDSGTGAGVDEMLVVATDAAGGWAGSGVSDESGYYAINGLATGSYTLHYDGRAAGRGYGAGWVTGPVGGQTGDPAGSPAGSGAVSVTTGTSTEAGIGVGRTVAATAPVSAPSGSPAPAVIVVNPVPGSPVSQPVVAGDPIAVTAPEVVGGIDFTVARMGAISGRVTDSATSAPLRWVWVLVMDAATGVWAGNAISGADGSYTVQGLPSGSYRLRFSSTSTENGGFQTAWYGSDGSASPAEVSVQLPDTTSGVDVRLAKAGGVSGTVTSTSCPGPSYVSIAAYDAEGGGLVGSTASSQRFVLAGLPAGSYKLVFSAPGYLNRWYPGTLDEASAQPVAVSAGSVKSGLDITLTAGGATLFGRFTGNGCDFSGATVGLSDWYSGGLIAETAVEHDGSYRLAGLPDASYQLRITLKNGNHWYGKAGENALAAPLVIAGGAAANLESDGICLPQDSLPGTGGRPALTDVLDALRVAVGLDPVTDQLLAKLDVASTADGGAHPDGVIDVHDALLLLQKALGPSTFSLPLTQ